MLYGRVYPFKASPRIHQGYTKRDPFCNALCYKYLPDAWTWQKRHMCRGVPFFPKTYARKLYIYRGGRQRAFLYVYIKKFFKKRVHPALFRPLRRATLWQYVRCSAVKPWCTLSAPFQGYTLLMCLPQSSPLSSRVPSCPIIGSSEIRSDTPPLQSAGFQPVK